MTQDEYKKELQKSALERLFDAEWERWSPEKIEQPESEQQLIPGRDWLCDRVWRSARLIVEIDGGQWAPGGGRHNTDEDRDKCNLLTLHGWKVLHYSGTMLQNDPIGVIKQIVSVLMKLKTIYRLTLPSTKKGKSCTTKKK